MSQKIFFGNSFSFSRNIENFVFERQNKMLRPYSLATETFTSVLKEDEVEKKKMKVVYYNRSRHGRIKKVKLFFSNFQVFSANVREVCFL